MSFWKKREDDLVDLWSLVHLGGGVIIYLVLDNIMHPLLALIGVFWAGFFWECLDWKFGCKVPGLDGSGASILDIVFTVLGGSLCANII